MEFIHKQYKSVRYLRVLPDGFEENKKYPVLIFLHGAGSRGMDMSLVENNPFFDAMKNRNDNPCIIIAPQCHDDTWFDIFQELKELIRSEASETFADSERIYAIGASMGGYGVWQAAMSMPEVFAAIVPICGGGMYWNAPRLKNIAVWAFHGSNDPVVLCRESEKMVEAVKNSGGDARLTIYENCGHDSWNGAYSEPGLFKWLLSHTKKTYEQGEALSGRQFG